MIAKVQSRKGKKTLTFDSGLGAHHPEAVVLDGNRVGHKFRQKHLDLLGYLLARQNQELSYGQIATELWKTTVGGPYGAIYKTTQQVAAIIGKSWIKHVPNVSIEFCTFVGAEPSADEYVLLKEVENVSIEANGTRVASLWVPPFRRPASPSGGSNELTLLLAKTAITNLVGRDDLWRDCLTWCRDSTLGPISVLCIQGRGGTGKTRFALELVHYLRSLEDWDARFVQFEKGEAFDLWATTAGSNHVLLAFDYASDHADAIADSLRLLRGREFGTPTRHLRILLLARTASFNSGWLIPFEAANTLEYGEAPCDYFRPIDPITELTPLSVDDRVRVFKQTYHSAAKYLGLDEQTLDESTFQDDHVIDVLTDPLSLMLVALVGLRSGLRGALLLTKDELAREAAKLFVEQRLRNAFRENAALALHMAMCATISSGLTLNAALETMNLESQVLHLGSIADPTAFLKRLAAWLPGKEVDCLGPVEPDILGEAFVLDMLRISGDGATELLLRCAQHHLSNTIRFIIRLVQDFTLVSRASRDEPVRWLGSVIEAGYVKEYPILQEILDALPPTFVDEVPHLFPVLEKAYHQITSTSSVADGNLAEELHADIPSMSIDFAIAELCAGHDLQASVRVDRAISTFQAMGKRLSGTSYVRFAVSLDRLARFEDKKGLPERALIHARAAVELFRPLADVGCGYFAPYLRNALLLVSVLECKQNEWNSAVAHADEALMLFRKAQGDSTEYYHECATLARCLGNAHSMSGNSEAALVNALEEVTLLKKLALGDRITYLPRLSEALAFLSAIQAETGGRKEALASGEDAVACTRELVNREGDCFLPHLELHLIGLLMILIDGRRRSRACEVAQELLIISQQIADKNLSSFVPLSMGSQFFNIAKRIAEPRKPIKRRT